MFCSLDLEEPTVTQDATGILTKHVNRFYLPSAEAQNVESFISVNNQRWPDFNSKGVAMHWNRLNRSLGTMSSIAHPTNIGDIAYGCVPGTDASSFVFGFDLEKAAHMGGTSSGVNVSTGGVVSVHLINIGSNQASPKRAYLCAIYDAVLELTDTGSSVFS